MIRLPPAVPGFGARLKALREARKMTQDFLSHSVGISTRVLQRVEADERSLPGDELQRAAEALKTDVADLFPEGLRVREFAALHLNGDLYTAETAEDGAPVPFVVFHMPRHEDPKTLETNEGLKRLWQDTYGIDAAATMVIRKATADEQQVWVGYTAHHVGLSHPEDRASFLIDNPHWEIGLREQKDGPNSEE